MTVVRWWIKYLTFFYIFIIWPDITFIDRLNNFNVLREGSPWKPLRLMKWLPVKNYEIRFPGVMQKRGEVWRHVTVITKFLDHGKLKQRRQQWQQERQKSNSFILAKQPIFTCISLFCAFLFHWDCDMKLPNFTRPLYGVGEHNTIIFFFFWIQPSTFCQHLPNWIRLMNETVQIHFLSKFLVCCHPKILLPWQRDVTTSLYGEEFFSPNLLI